MASAAPPTPMRTVPARKPAGIRSSVSLVGMGTRKSATPSGSPTPPSAVSAAPASRMAGAGGVAPAAMASKASSRAWPAAKSAEPTMATPVPDRSVETPAQ